MAYIARVEQAHITLDGNIGYPVTMFAAKDEPEHLIMQMEIDNKWHTLDIPVSTIRSMLGLEVVSDELPGQGE